jgi:hypothetical protein
MQYKKESKEWIAGLLYFEALAIVDLAKYDGKEVKLVPEAVSI